MTFPLDKILTVSARDYVSSINTALTKKRSLSYFDLVGVHYSGELGIKGFVENIPCIAEVVIDFRESFGNSYVASGTALIERKVALKRD